MNKILDVLVVCHCVCQKNRRWI